MLWGKTVLSLLIDLQLSKLKRKGKNMQQQSFCESFVVYHTKHLNIKEIDQDDTIPFQINKRQISKLTFIFEPGLCFHDLV